MKLSKERIAWLREKLSRADYCQLGEWGVKMEGVDVQQDLEDALDDIAELEAELKTVKTERDALRTVLFGGISLDVIEQLREDYPAEFEQIEGE